MRTAKAIRHGPGVALAPTISIRDTATRNASAIQPHDREKYPPWLAFATVTSAATDAPTTHVRTRRGIIRGGQPRS
jgi:hypothetical protein